MQYKIDSKKNRFRRFLIIALAAVLLFKSLDFVLSEITDMKAYRDAEPVSDSRWEEVYIKLCGGEALTDDEYELVFSQTGLGRPALEALAENGELAEVLRYRDFYLQSKSYECVREGVFACHEKITDSEGSPILNPPFANLENGDIILTLSIHSLGWRHGHAAVVVDAERGTTAEALMIGEKSCFGTLYQWRTYPLVAVLRAKNLDAETRADIAEFAADNMVGLYYSLTSGVIGGRNTEKTPSLTQCAHLVWYSYLVHGVNIDSDGGPAITPYDILQSEELEIVQIYGNINEL